jgi:hypothetical protein
MIAGCGSDWGGWRASDGLDLPGRAGVLGSGERDRRREATGKGERRKGGKLPPCVVAYLVMALALFADEDYEEVAARLAGTFADWGGWEESGDRAPTSGGITQARQRPGPEPLKELFAQVARPVADMVTAARSSAGGG